MKRGSYLEILGSVIGTMLLALLFITNATIFYVLFLLLEKYIY
jgi:hypothetical protein